MWLNRIRRIDGDAIGMNIGERISIQRNNFTQIDNGAFGGEFDSFERLIPERKFNCIYFLSRSNSHQRSVQEAEQQRNGFSIFLEFDSINQSALCAVHLERLQCATLRFKILREDKLR